MTDVFEVQSDILNRLSMKLNRAHLLPSSEGNFSRNDVWRCQRSHPVISYDAVQTWTF